MPLDYAAQVFMKCALRTTESLCFTKVVILNASLYSSMNFMKDTEFVLVFLRIPPRTRFFTVALDRIQEGRNDCPQKVREAWSTTSYIHPPSTMQL